MKTAPLIAAVLLAASALGAAKPKPKEPELPFPPTLPGGKTIVTERSEEFLKPPSTLRPGVAVAKEAPTVDFMYYPGQDYPGKPWSVWGDGVCVGGKYYSAIGDHLAPAGTARVFEYDPATRSMRQLLDVKSLLKMPEGHYVPGKIHSRLDDGGDGWLYCGTHRGSSRTTTDAFHYTGDWILRVNPATLKAEVVARGVVPKHCIPCSVTDAKRGIFYGGTAAGSDAQDQSIQFFAYDLRHRKLLYSGPNGPGRYMILAGSTGRVYFVPGEGGNGPLVRFDPAQPGKPVQIAENFGLRAATTETADGMVYSVSKAGRETATIWALNTRTEKVKEIGSANVGVQGYITTLDIDPTGRFLYYTPGAHGGSEGDGTPIVQYDLKLKRAKVLAFLHPFYKDRYGAALKGTFSAALDSTGERYFTTWNTSRGSKAWDSCTLTVVQIPKSER